MNTLTSLLFVPAAALLTTSAFWVAPLRAHADSAYGCLYPYACIYRDPGLRGGIVARFQVVTSGWQSVTARGFSAYNTRNDDIVYLFTRTENHWSEVCMGPNAWGEVGPTPIQGIRIDSRSSC
ncbi:hypothetical protein ETD86_40425 [Nonomuraea turkmeniaca]|uniref:Peptidase inhibitor family I36 protein n=1 Tax=Nonomuraea turkmeniaca TaxID=103838 RepID=A0A5S4F2K8_9ACTN|nr:hypothetical protein [Nonomuraea turkmeniaca]TMR10243.1 hypothetical protein ETD86_40425 [Nonomuraea turkmeniaca]